MLMWNREHRIDNSAIMAKASIQAGTHMIRMISQYWYIVLSGLIFFGALLRGYNLNWDEGQVFHPDEGNVARAVIHASADHKFDPAFYAYNGFTIYLARLLANICVFFTHNDEWLTKTGQVNQILRFLSLVFSVAAIPVLFLVVRRITGSNLYALAGASLLTMSTGVIQSAHFGTTESALVFLILLISYFSIRIIQEPLSVGLTMFLAVASGTALGSKTTAVAIMVMPLLTWLLVLIRERNPVIIKYLVFYLFITFLVFFVSSPYTFLNYETFFRTMQYESGITDGSNTVFYTTQFQGTTPYLFQAQQLVWYVNLITVVLGLTGIVIGIVYTVYTADKLELLPVLAFGLLYSLYVGSWYAKFIRYTVPLVPVLIIAAVWIIQFGVVYFQQKFRDSSPEQATRKNLERKNKVNVRLRILIPRLFVVLLGVSVIVQAFAGIAFFSIYTRKSTRMAASEWMYQELPYGATMLVERYDYRLPVGWNNHVNRFNYIEVDMYTVDSEGKIELLSSALTQADYIILASKRVYGWALGSENHPLTSSYYELLFPGDLGYTLEREFSSSPSFLGLQLNDDHVEETFKIFDHPKILVFKKVDRNIDYLRILQSGINHP